MTVQRIDHKCARHLSLFSSFSHISYSSFSPSPEQSWWGVCIRLRFIAARAACHGPHLCPVSFLLLKARPPTSLSRRGYRHHCAGDALVKSAFLHAMLTTIVKTDRNEKRCTYMIDRSFIKPARDIKLKLPTSRAGFQMNPHVLPVITLYAYDNNQCAHV